MIDQYTRLESIIEDTVTITKKEYLRLIEDSDWLGYLKAAGVDNWDGFDYARELRDADKKDGKDE